MSSLTSRRKIAIEILKNFKTPVGQPSRLFPLSEYSIESEKNHSALLLPAIESQLKINKIKLTVTPTSTPKPTIINRGR